MLQTFSIEMFPSPTSIIQRRYVKFLSMLFSLSPPLTPHPTYAKHIKASFVYALVFIAQCGMFGLSLRGGDRVRVLFCRICFVGDYFVTLL